MISHRTLHPTIRGHPFMTSQRRDRGSGSGGRLGEVGEGGGGQRHVDVHTENYSPLTLSCFLLIQRSWRSFSTRSSSLDLIKSVILLQYKLVISINNSII